MTNADDDKDESKLFLEAVKDVRPIKVSHIHHTPPRPKPRPKRFVGNEKQALADSLSDHFIPASELESGGALQYLRAGHSPDILNKLRRGNWPVQAAIDLHGLVSDEARLYVVEFLDDCKKRGIRCARIIHGKGLSSRNGEPILKNKLRSWLMQIDAVIAYTQARVAEGGAGAVVVLLKAL